MSDHRGCKVGVTLCTQGQRETCPGFHLDLTDVLRRAFDMRVMNRLERRPDARPEDGPSYAQGAVNGVSALVEALFDAGLPVTIQTIDVTHVAAEIERTDP